MTVSLKEAMGRISARRRKAIEARSDVLIAEEMTLRDLRKALELTQQNLAEALNIKQESISNIEKRSDLLISTLRGYVEAMGGDLSLLVRFPNRPPVELKTLPSMPKSVKTRSAKPHKPKTDRALRTT